MIAVIVAIDRITKYLAKRYLGTGEVKTFINGVAEFVYTENTGAAFSMLSGGRWLLAAVTAVAVIACLIYMFSRAQNNLWLFWSLGVIVAGAIGNLIDRIFLGYVIDFINPTFVNFAVFNIADCAVTLGAVSLIAYLFTDIIVTAKKEKKNEPRD